eukprot:920311-Amphidinium_carterae.1
MAVMKSLWPCGCAFMRLQMCRSTVACPHASGHEEWSAVWAVESIILDDAQLVCFLAAAVWNKPPGARVVSLSYAQLHKVLLDLSCHCSLGNFCIRPHSFRRGGATEYFQTCGSLSLLLVVLKS